MNETHPSIEQIVDYLHGELPPAEDAAVHAHLSSCHDCDQRRAEEVALTETLRAHARATERSMPSALISIIRRHSKRPRPFDDRLRGIFRPLIVLPAAALLAAILVVGIGAWRERAAPQATIDAAYYVQNHAAMAATAPFADEAPMLTSDDEAR
jgi:anti-sigma factor RsiW